MAVTVDSILHDPVTFNNQNDLNLIIDERLKFDREYIILDKNKIKQAITDPDTLLTIFNSYEINVLLKQTYEMNYVSTKDYNTLINNHDKIYDIIPMNDIHNILFKQLSYVTRIPSISDLEANGLLDAIIHVIQTHPELLTEEHIVDNYTDQYLTQKLKENVFVSFEKTEQILDIQENILKILTPDEMINLLNRVKPYLSFVDDDNIKAVKTLITNNDNNILSVYTQNEIKVIMDKEIELKNLLLKALTPESLQKIFDSFKDDFLNNNVTDIINNKIQALKDEMLGNNYDELISTQVDNYLTSKYNTLIKQMLASTFQTFKNDFISNDLQQMIQDSFNKLKEDFFGDNYTGLVQLQVDNYLNNNFPAVTTKIVQDWINEEINKKDYYGIK